MMKKELQFLLALFLLVQCVFAQRFPVKIVPRVQAPSPVNFYNYADETSLNSPITVQLFLNDLTVSNRQIRLKTYFEGGNINFTSKDFVIGAENLFIEGGIPLTLKNTELAPYYKLENLQGISNTVYGRSIPEGSYNFCFEVFDFLSGAKLSAKECRTVFIFKNEPPILNIPLNGTNIKPNDFENIVFQWTPRHINVSNVEYEFSLVEIWDDAVNPQTAFLSQTPIYEETTRATTLIYGPDKPLLLPEKRYAWRIKAKALQGLEEIGLFKNQGFSEVFWFSRTAPCMVPENIRAEPKGLSKINVFWDQDPTIHSEYVIAYREADKEYAKWFTKRTNSAWATIWNLKPGTKYEYKVKGKCKYQFSDYSEVQYITTDIVTNDDANYNCGIVPDHIAISNRDPHPDLRRGDEVTAGDFLIVLTHISSQSNGRISGVGYVVVPYLNFAKFAVYYENVLINTDNQLAEGEIVTLYDPEFGENASMTVDINFENEEEEEPVAESEGVNQDTNTSDTPVENTGGETPENNTPTETTEGTETPPPGTGENPPPTGEEIPPTDTTKTKSEDPPPPSDETGEGEIEEKEAVIDYEGKIYKHEDIIEVPYNIDKTDFAFTLKDYPENAKINWQVLKGGTDNTSAFANNETIHDNFGINMKEIHILDVVANYNDKKIKVTIKRGEEHFQLKSIYAYPNDNSQRKAYWGETLYLVKNTVFGKADTRLINFKSTISPDLDKSQIKSISWYYNDTKVTDFENKKKSFKWLSSNNEYFTAKVQKRKPVVTEKHVNVKWIEGGVKEVNFSPLGPLAIFAEKSKKIKKFLEKFQKFNIGNISINVDPIVKGSQKVNEEIFTNRLYRRKERSHIKGGFNINKDKFISHPVLKALERINVAKIGLTIKLQAGLKFEGGIEKIKIVEKDDYEPNNPYGRVNPYGCMSAKLGAELLVARSLVTLNIFGEASSCLGGLMEYKFDTEDFDGYMYLDPLILTGKVELSSTTLKFKIVDWSDSIKIFERITIGND